MIRPLLLAVAALSISSAASATRSENSSASTTPSPINRKLAKLLASGDGKTAKTAFKVKSVGDEYEVLRALDLQPQSQSLIVNLKPYDQITAIDSATGETREVWFDISSFYGKMF